MAHPIKFRRAKHLASMGAHHETFSALWHAIPATVRSTSSAAHLAELVDAMYQATRAAFWHGAAEAA